jgi:hypothetical protein
MGPKKRGRGRPPREQAWGAINIRLPMPLFYQVREMADSEAMPVAVLMRRLIIEEHRRFARRVA